MEFAHDYEWVEWLEAEGKLQNLFMLTPNYNEVDELLAEWLVEQFLLVIRRIISINLQKLF